MEITLMTYAFTFRPQSHELARTKGSWFFTRNALRNNVLGTVAFCPECEHGIGLQHQIDDNGVVTPSLGCPLCNWHCAIAVMVDHGAEKRRLFDAMRSRIDMNNGNDEGQTAGNAAAGSTSGAGEQPANAGNRGLPDDSRATSGNVGGEASSSNSNSLNAAGAPGAPTVDGGNRETVKPVGSESDTGAARSIGQEAAAKTQASADQTTNATAGADGATASASLASTSAVKDPDGNAPTGLAPGEPDHFIPDLDVAPPAAFYTLLDLGKISKDDLTQSASVQIIEPRRIASGNEGNVRILGWIGGELHEAWLAMIHFEQRVKDAIVDGVQTFRMHTEEELAALTHVHLAVHGQKVVTPEGEVAPLAPAPVDAVANKIE